MRVVFSYRAYASIMAETTEKIKTETGGLFLGRCIDDVWYVIEAIDPGPKSVFEVAYFEYDQKYTQHLINKIANLYDARLALIGLWHRHPGSMDYFSSTDDNTNEKYASLNPQGAISGLVNIDPKFRLTMYQVDKPCIYSVIKYEVGDNLIPKELMAFKSVERFEHLMDELMGGETHKELTKSVSLKAFLRRIKPYLLSYRVSNDFVLQTEEGSVDALIDIAYDDIDFLGNEVGIAFQITNDDNRMALVQDAIEGKESLYLYKVKGKEQYLLENNGELYTYEKELLSILWKKYLENEARRNNKVTKRGTGSVFEAVIRRVIIGKGEGE